MLDTLKTTTIRTYGNLCKRLKINAWQSQVFMDNSIVIMDKLEERIAKLEKKLKRYE